jgi:transposase
METRALDLRSQRGLTLAQTRGKSIKPIVATKYLVPSASHSGGYVVDVETGTCTCPDYTSLGRSGTAHRCKHLWATLYVRREIPLPDGNSVVIEEQVRINYPRDWHATNLARTKIPRLGPGLLADLIRGLPIPEQPIRRGRPRVPVRDVLLAAALRAFEDTTAGSAVVAAENYQSLGLLQMDHVPSYNTLLREFARPDYMPLLHKLVAGSAWPLIPLESKFAIDGTGFGTSVHDCYYAEKHGPASQKRKPTPKHRWVEAKIVFGTTTHVVAAVQVTEQHVAECPLMPELLKRTTENGGRVSEWLADAAYMSWYNVEAVEKAGAKAYIDFPPNVTGATNPIVKRLYNRMCADREDYARHYHQRSLAETGNSMIKTRFGHRLRSRVPNAQYAEAMLRVISHNVACLVQAVDELKIEARYWTSTPQLAGSLQ